MALSKLVAITAAALLVVAPTAATAGTRAAESIPAVAKPAAKKVAAPKTKAQPGKAKSKDLAGEGQAQGGSIIIGILAAAAVVGGAIVLTDS